MKDSGSFELEQLILVFIAKYETASSMLAMG